MMVSVHIMANACQAEGQYIMTCSRSVQLCQTWVGRLPNSVRYATSMKVLLAASSSMG